MHNTLHSINGPWWHFNFSSMLHQPPIMFEAPLITIANMGRVGEQDHEELGITSPGTLFGTPYIFGLFHLLVVHLALFIALEKS